MGTYVAGRPDWTNFHLFGDRLPTLCSCLEISEAEHIFWRHFSWYTLQINVRQNWVGLHFGRFVRKLAWLPWYLGNPKLSFSLTAHLSISLLSLSPFCLSIRPQYCVHISLKLLRLFLEQLGRGTLSRESLYFFLSHFLL
jgi:hypothetical protein